MISELKIGNFKAFGPAQTIPLRPITLVFGPNSAGKSSIIQSLLLARHIHDTGKPDAHQTTLGGASVDLGGFARYVHQHEDSRDTTIHLTFKRSDIGGKFHYLDGFEKLTVAYAIGLNRSDQSNSQVVIQSATFLLDECELIHFVRSESGELHMDKAALLERSLLALADLWTFDDLERWEALRGILVQLNERGLGVLEVAEKYGLTSADLLDPVSGKPSLKGARYIYDARMRLLSCDDPSEHQDALVQLGRRILDEAEQRHKDAIVHELLDMKFRAASLSLENLGTLIRESDYDLYETEMTSPECGPFRFYKKYLGGVSLLLEKRIPTFLVRLR